MAVFYKWIKGCASGSQINNGSWSYVSWGEYDGNLNVKALPHLYISTTRQDGLDSSVYTSQKDMGYFLTNQAVGVQIRQSWDFVNGKGLVFYSEEDNNNAKAHLYSNSSTFCFNIRDLSINDLSNIVSGSCATAMRIYGKGSGSKQKIVEMQYKLQTSNLLEATKGITITSDGLTVSNGGITVSSGGITISTGGLSASSGTISALSIKGSTISSQGECSASYFTATSDRRAKENIKPATYNALELIKKLPIYTYNYKNQPETVTGIIAQDLFAVQPEELDLVSNTNATGKDGDYMSIKNDKLMFVLMKAIQEQQEQIEQLQAEIRILKRA